MDRILSINTEFTRLFVHQFTKKVRFYDELLQRRDEGQIAWVGLTL